MILPRFLPFAGALALFVNSSSAALLAGYSFNTDVNPNTPGTTNVTASAFTGTGTTARSQNSYAYQFTQTAVSPAYMEFSLTAANGYVLDLSTINFSYIFLQSAGTESHFTGTISLAYSFDSFATSTPVQAFTFTSAAVINSGSATFADSGVLDLTAVPDANSIKFRFYLSNDGNLNSSNYRYGIDSVAINGNLTAVPEPTVLGLGLVATAGLAIRRRRL